MGSGDPDVVCVGGPSVTRNAASLYTYFGATTVIMLLVLLPPPNRPRAWLSGLLR
jgi:hypothetical protein